MSDKGTLLRETVEAFADLGTMLDGLTEEQASRIRFGVRGVRDLVIHWPGLLPERGDHTAHADEPINKARMFWAPDSFWGRRYPVTRNGACSTPLGRRQK
jgi:hypothetical protein